MSLAIATHVTLPRSDEPLRVSDARTGHATGVAAVVFDAPLRGAGLSGPTADRARAQAFAEQMAMQDLDRLRQLDRVYEQVDIGLDRIRALAVRASADPGPIHERALTALLDDLALHAAATANPGLSALDGGDISIEVLDAEQARFESTTLVDLDVALYGEAGLAQLGVSTADAAARLRTSADATLAELRESRGQLRTMMGRLERSIVLLDQAREASVEPSDTSVSGIRSDLAALPPRELALLSSPSARGMMLLEAT